MKKFSNFILYSLSTLIILGLLLLFLLPTMPFLGNYEVRIVKSGSMEPAIMTGAVVLVKEEASYQKGDVITFSSAGSDIPTSHRIVNLEERNGEVVFETKGDANEDADIARVAKENILGKVVFDLPYIGYILDFARQPLGFALLIGVPALIIILDEIENIWRELRRGKNKEEIKEDLDVLVIAPYQPGIQPEVKASHIKGDKVVIERKMITKKVTAPKTMSAFVIIFSIMTVSLWGNDTVSYYASEVLLRENTLQAQTLDFSVTTDRETLFLNEDGFLEGENVIAVEVKNEAANDLKFDVRGIVLAGNLNFCAEIWLETDLSLPYSGKLSWFDDKGYLMDRDFNLSFSLAEDAEITLVEGMECAMTLNFKGYLDGTEKNQGYVVEKDLVFNFVVGGLENRMMISLSFGTLLNSSGVAVVDSENSGGASDKNGEDGDETGENEGGEGNESVSGGESEVDLENDDGNANTTDDGAEDPEIEEGSEGTETSGEEEEGENSESDDTEGEEETKEGDSNQDDRDENGENNEEGKDDVDDTDDEEVGDSVDADESDGDDKKDDEGDAVSEVEGGEGEEEE